MNVYRSKTFRAGNSDALRLPKEISPGPGVEVEITKTGNLYTFRLKTKRTPKETAELLRSLPKPDRIQKRDKIIFPKRPGL
jgi:antitoxin VapB